MATLVEDSGNYYLQFYDSDRQPKRKRLALRTKRKKTAKKLQRRHEDAFATGDWDPWTGKLMHEPKEHLTVREALDLFVEAKREAGLAEKSITCYEGIVRRAGVLDMPVDSVQKDDIAGFVYDRDKADATRHKRFRHWRAFLNWCEDKSYVNGTPDMEEPQTYEKLPKAVRETELMAITEEMRKYRQKLKDEGNLVHSSGVVWRIPVFWFAFYTGLRAAEIGRLRWSHVDLSRRELVMEKQKNRTADLLPLSRKAVGVLEDLDHRRGLVFVGPRTDPEGDRSVTNFRNNASRTFRRFKDKAGIERPITFHGLRHGFATRLAEEGCSAHTIQRLCRHKSIQTSVQYVHLSTGNLRDQLDDAFGAA